MRWFCYPTGDEPDLWAHWLARQSKRAQAKHAVVMRFLSDGHWQSPHWRALVGAYQGLGEIRIAADRQWRLIGRREEAENAFTLLMICYHKDKVYDPRDALETALRRWREIENGLERTARHDHPA